jgi:hypothetical protein
MILGMAAADRVRVQAQCQLQPGQFQPGQSRPGQARPGRRAVVIPSLADLRGPTKGAVELPLWLFWSCPGHTFDLGDPDMRQWLYQTVLREAGSAEDLASYLDRGTLIALWPDLYLPRGIRRAWEDRHPVLRAVAAAAA